MAAVKTPEELMDTLETPDSDEVLSLKEMNDGLESTAKRLEKLCSETKAIYEKKLRDSLRGAQPYPGKQLTNKS